MLLGGIIHLRGVEVKRLATVVTLAILLVGLILSGLTDLNISVADTSVPDNKITTGHAEASDSSTTAMTVIAWTTPSGEGGANGL
jgi:hydrogenase/urease accessory protein HupE